MRKKDLITIALHMTDQSRSKKHGSYKLYEDEKIKISYDTYYPNLQVDIKVDGAWEMVARYSGHGYVQEYHKGRWEEYVMSLLPIALERKRKMEAEQKINEQARKEELFKPINDAAVFAQ